MKLKSILSVAIYLLMTSAVKAQDIELFFGLSVDPKMLINGHGYGYEAGQESSLDFEIKAGWIKHLNHDHAVRIGMFYEVHKNINFRKWTFLAADYVLKDRLLWFKANGFSQSAGLEIGVIYRIHPDASFDQPDNYIRVVSSETYGVNAELQYSITDNVSVGTGVNAFAAEYELKRYGKKYRWDAMVSVYLKL
jgi:hypothetical protein